jgi:hypothetical protein
MKFIASIAILFACFATISHSSFAQNNTKDFTTPGQYKFVVPKGVSSITVSLTGPGGWGGGTIGALKGMGGRGGFVSGSLAVTEGETLLIVVGSGATPNKIGGVTGIIRGNVYLALAAAGGNGSSHGGHGGNGGPLGSHGSAGSGSFQSGNGGMGAIATAGGNGGSAGAQGTTGKNGIAMTGGTNNAKASGEGWGGAGWFGGGAAGTYGSAFITGDPFASGGGGGGSNYTKGLNGQIVNNSNGSVAGNGSASGIHGKVTISF